jgi:hypothetical protein
VPQNKFYLTLYSLTKQKKADNPSPKLTTGNIFHNSDQSKANDRIDPMNATGIPFQARLKKKPKYLEALRTLGFVSSNCPGTPNAVAMQNKKPSKCNDK